MFLLRTVLFSIFRTPLFITLTLAFLLSTSTHAKIENNQASDDVCFAHASGVDYSSPDETALQDAVDAASAGDLIKVAGTCAGTHSQGGRTVTVYVAKTLTIQGGYVVGNWTDPPNPALNPTTLNAMPEAGRVVFATGGNSITLSGLTITGGSENNGGGVYNRATLTIIDSKITENSASNNGGGISSEFGTLTLHNSTVHGNTADGSGGGIYNTAGTVTISNTTFDDNTAGSKGGAIYSTGLLEITNSTISGNQVGGLSGGGGALVVAESSAFIEYSTIVGNSAPFVTGYDGIWVEGGSLAVSSSIILGSIGSENCRISEGGTLTSGGYNLSSDGTCPFTQESDFNTTNPLLGPLADNGGSTKTHLLLPFSPAIDSIPNNANNCGTTIDVDQREVARPVEDACDRGAVELDTNYAPVAAQDSYSLSEDSSLTVSPPGILENDSDGDWDNNLTSELDNPPPNGSFLLNTDGSFEFTPGSNFCGTDTFTYFAKDGSLTSASSTVSLDVTCFNDVPTANAGINRTVDEGSTVQFTGDYFDPETNVNPQFSWDFGDGTGATGSLMPTHRYVDDGIFTVQLTVIDDEGATGSDTAVVTVKNVAPFLTIPGNKTVVIGQQVSFSVDYFDPGILDTHTASINWRDSVIEPANIDPSMMKISGSHIYTGAGNYNVGITVTDNGGAQTTVTFTVTVTMVGQRVYWIYLPVILGNDR